MLANPRHLATGPLMGMHAGLKAACDGVEQCSATDFTEDLKVIDVPTLIAHADDGRIVPIGAAAYRSAGPVKDVTSRSAPGHRTV